MKKAFYIFSFFYKDYDYRTMDFDWFIGQDFDEMSKKRVEACKYMVEVGHAKNIFEAKEKLDRVYKQNTDYLIKNLSN